MLNQWSEIKDQIDKSGFSLAQIYLNGSEVTEKQILSLAGEETKDTHLVLFFRDAEGEYEFNINTVHISLIRLTLP